MACTDISLPPIAEHVFELHMVKDFFFWMVKDTAGPGMSPHQLKTTFTQQDPTPNEDQPVVQAMMKKLAWWSLNGGGSISNLFVVRKGLNLLKGAVSNTQTFPCDESWEARVLAHNSLQCTD